MPNSTPKSSPKVNWDDKDMVTGYANVTNVAITSDEVMMMFGTSDSWNNTEETIDISLSNRLIMTHASAKRFLLLLTKTLADYEKGQRAAAPSVTGTAAPAAATAKD